MNMTAFNNIPTDREIRQIVDNFNADRCYYLMDTKLFQRFSMEGKMTALTEELTKKARLPVRIVVKFNGLLQLHHLTQKKNAESIRRNGLDREYFDRTNFDPAVTGLYCVRADCPHGFKAMQIVRTDYADLTHIVTFNYDGEYYLTVNNIEEYIVITQPVPATAVTVEALTTKFRT